MRLNLCGERIRIARALQRPPMSQRDLIAKLELRGIYMSSPTLSKIEHGDRCVTDKELQAFSEILRVDLDWLLKDPAALRR